MLNHPRGTVSVMAARTSNELSVQGTNDSCTVSKCSMVKQGYFDDPFIDCFVVKKSRRAPLINRGYYVRAKAISSVVDDFLRSCARNDHPAQVISLGAGFDSLFFRIADARYSFDQITFIEVDFPSVAKRKANLILNNEKLLHRLRDINSTPIKADSNEFLILDSDSYKLLGVDLSNLGQLEQALRNDCSTSFTVPTLFLSECSITYMKERRSSALIKWAAAKFENAIFSTYEQITPNDGFGLVMLRHFDSLASPLSSIKKYPDLESQRMRYLDLGWQRCTVLDMNTFYREVLPLTENHRLQRLEPFDEFEEFHMKCGHYVLVCASQGSVSVGSTLKNCSSFIIDRLLVKSSSLCLELRPLGSCGQVYRYGHCSVQLAGDKCVTIGGFGQSRDGGHKRLEDIHLTDLDGQTDIVMQCPVGSLKGGRLHASASRVSDSSFLVLGGRTAPLSLCPDILLVDVDAHSKTDATSARPLVTISKVEPKSGNCFQLLRWRHCSSTVVVGGKSLIVVFGGLNQSGETLGDCHFLDPSDWSWTMVHSRLGDIPKARHSAASCSVGSNFVISGGIDEDMRPLNSVHVLECTSRTWSRVEVSGLLPRYSHTAHVWKDRLYLLGGVNSLPGLPPGIAVVDMSSGVCKELLLQALSSPYLLNKHSSFLDEREARIVVLGGGGNCFSFGTHLNPSALVFHIETVGSPIRLGMDDGAVQHVH